MSSTIPTSVTLTTTTSNIQRGQQQATGTATIAALSNSAGTTTAALSNSIGTTTTNQVVGLNAGSQIVVVPDSSVTGTAISTTTMSSTIPTSVTVSTFINILQTGQQQATGTNKINAESAKTKCKNFFATILTQARGKSATVAQSICNLIQRLIDDKVSPEVFTEELQKFLRSPPQPCLVPFFKKTLPYLRASLSKGEITIEGVRPPPLSSVTSVAGMTTVIPAVVEIITCPVCLEIFNEDTKSPRMLSCGHSLCHSCIEMLLVLRPNCPTCRTDILFENSESIPVNYSLKSLINVGYHNPNTDKNVNSQSKSNEAHSSNSQPSETKRKLDSEGYCQEHGNCNDYRCMDCKIWICGSCALQLHKDCRFLLVDEAHKEYKKLKILQVDLELADKIKSTKSLTESLKVLLKEKRSLNKEIKATELKLKTKSNLLTNKEKHIKDLKSLKSKKNKYCNKLKQIKETVERSLNGTEFADASNQLNQLLEEGKSLTLKELETLCQNGSVYTVDVRYSGTRYGKVAVKDGRIWVYSFKSEKPDATNLFNFSKLLSRLNGSGDLPKTVFLQLKGFREDEGDYFDVVIETDGVSPRAKNCSFLCSALKGASYKGSVLQGFLNSYNIIRYQPPLLEGIRDDDCSTPLTEGGVHGMLEQCSGFGIQLTDNPLLTIPKFGTVIAGLQLLKDRVVGDCLVAECGLVI